MNTDDLASFPEDHPYRNTPLIELGAFYQAPSSKVWAELTPAYTLSKQKNTYNDLAPVWRRDTWKATKLLKETHDST